MSDRATTIIMAIIMASGMARGMAMLANIGTFNITAMCGPIATVGRVFAVTITDLRNSASSTVRGIRAMATDITVHARSVMRAGTFPIGSAGL